MTDFPIARICAALALVCHSQKGMISKYIGIIPLSGDVCPAAEQPDSAGPFSRAWRFLR
jgi:hypothetical protein